MRYALRDSQHVGRAFLGVAPCGGQVATTGSICWGRPEFRPCPPTSASESPTVCNLPFHAFRDVMADKPLFEGALKVDWTPSVQTDAGLARLWFGGWGGPKAE